jgi:DNA-binding NarL/FixJ family response regulator
MTIRLLIVDDHSIVRQGLVTIMATTEDIEVIGEAQDGSQALDEVRRLRPDVALVDYSIPGIQGADLIHRLKAEQRELRILMLSMHKDNEVVSRMLKAGADGYVTKDVDAPTLLGAIRKVAAGHHFVDPELMDSMIFESRSAAMPQRALSNREFQVLRMVADGQAVVSIAETLHLSAKTVSTHKTNGMRKLHLRSTTDLIRFALQHGLAT